MLRLLFTLILSFSSLHAQGKLNPGYDIPPHVQFIFKMYQAIDREDKELINPKAFDREDLHYALTLFFDPDWGSKSIPTTLRDLEVHYNKRRKILIHPYWAHKKCLEVLDRFDHKSYLTKDNILKDVPVTLTDSLTREAITHPEHLNILLDLNNAKKAQDPIYSESRALIPLNMALPTEIENPLFLMALAQNLQYLPSSLLEVMKDYTEDKIQEDQFAQALKQSMRPDNDLADTFQFDYINWYIQHYDVFGESAS